MRSVIVAVAFLVVSEHADQHDQLLAAGDPGIEEVSLQHGVVLRHHRDDHGGIFRALAFVDGRRVGGHQRPARSETAAACRGAVRVATIIWGNFSF